MQKVCTAWRVGLRRVLGLPVTTHKVVLPSISCRPPLLDEIAKKGLLATPKDVSHRIVRL